MWHSFVLYFVLNTTMIKHFGVIKSNYYVIIDLFLANEYCQRRDSLSMAARILLIG